MAINERVRKKPIILGVTGASGALFARRTLQILEADKRVEQIHLVISGSGLKLLRDELDLDVPVEVDDRLIQYDMGSATGLPMQELTAADMVSRYGAEDPDNFCARIFAALDELNNRSSDGLVVSHSGVARMILARAAGLPPSKFRQLPMLGNAAPFLVVRNLERT